MERHNLLDYPPYRTLPTNQYNFAENNTGRITYDSSTQSAAGTPSNATFASYNTVISSPLPSYDPFLIFLNRNNLPCRESQRPSQTNVHRHPLSNRRVRMHPYSQGSRETSGSTFVTPQKQLKDKPAVLLKLNESVNPDHKNAISSAQNEHLPTIDDLIKVKCDAYYYIKRCKPDTAEQMFRKLYPDHMSSLPECHRIEVITGLVQAMNDQCKSLDAEGLLLKYRDNPGDPTIPSGNKYIDIALSRTWQRMHKYKSAEELLLAIVNRTPQMSMAEQCKPSDEQRINQELATLWISMGHYPMANEISPKKL